MKKIEIISNLSDYQVDDLVELYKHEFWCCDRKKSDIKVMLKNTDIVIGLEDENKKLLGFARILTDYIYKATIYDIIVHSKYRGSLNGRSIKSPKII